MNWRSLLFVAADDERRVGKAGTCGADAVILDLEDAVPPARKPAARAQFAGAVAQIRSTGTPVVARINANWWDAIADLEQVLMDGVTAIMVPKAEEVHRLTALNAMICEGAAARGLAAAPGLIPLLESPAALLALTDIAGVAGVCGLALGSEDFSLALGVPPSSDVLDLPCRQIALAAAGRGHMALGIPLSIGTIDDMEGWSAAVGRARALGVTGALCIHPRQVEPANRGFSRSEAEEDWAIAVLTAWEEKGRPGVFQLNGRMVDLPVVLAAKRALA